MGELNILTIDDNPKRVVILEQGLVEAAYAPVITIHSMTNLIERIQTLASDVVIVNLANPKPWCPGEHVPADTYRASSHYHVHRSIKRCSYYRCYRGRCVCLCGGWSAKERVQPIVKITLSRFAAFDRIQRERDAAMLQPAERKEIEKAKGLLMEKREISENEVYTALWQAAMRQKRRTAERSHSVIIAFKMELWSVEYDRFQRQPAPPTQHLQAT